MLGYLLEETTVRYAVSATIAQRNWTLYQEKALVSPQSPLPQPELCKVKKGSCACPGEARAVLMQSGITGMMEVQSARCAVTM